MCSCGGGGVGGVSACVVMAAAVVVVAVLGEGGRWRQSGGGCFDTPASLP